MKFKRTLAASGIAALTVVLAACGSAEAGRPTTPTTPPTPLTMYTAVTTATMTATVAPPTVTVTATPAPQAPVTTTETTTAAPPPPPPAPNTSAAPAPTQAPQGGGGGMSDGEIRNEVDGAFGKVNTYWKNLFSGWVDEQGGPISWWVPDRFGGDGFYDSEVGVFADCGGEYLAADNAWFCGNPYTGSGEVSWDMTLMRAGGAIGDGPLYATVAHEVGHAGQWRFRFDEEYGAVPDPDSPEYELQADCLAGAALGKAVQDGYLSLEDGDLDEITAFTTKYNHGTSHGTTAQRIDAFLTGYNTGDIESCLYNQGVPPS